MVHRYPSRSHHQLVVEASAQTAEQTADAVAAAERSHTTADAMFTRQRLMRCAKRYIDSDGLWNLHARLTPDDGAKVDAVLSAHNETLWRHDKDTARTQDRAPQQRLADALVTMAEHARRRNQIGRQPLGRARSRG